MAFKIVKCPFCQSSVEYNPAQDDTTVICSECHHEFEAQSTTSMDNSSTNANYREQNSIGDWRFCRNCGNKLSANAYSCPQCGEPTSLASKHNNATYNDDHLEGGWIAGVWFCALFIPFGWVIVIVLTSVLYWSWRKDFPHKARSINLHGWSAIIASFILSLWLGWTFLTILKGLLNLVN